MSIGFVIDTHVHADHLSGARALANAAKAPHYLGAAAEVGFDFSPLNDGDVLEIGNRRARIIHTPGHTHDHVCLLVDDWFVLTGDTLFVGDVGRVDLALTEVDDSELRTRARDLHGSLQTLMTLRDDVEIYPGHYAGSTCGRGMDGKPISTIGHERRGNEALSLDVEEFVRFQLANVPSPPQDFETIKRANIARDATKPS
jgi:glyoxylase-like metal-dependent hydrolase (beta-lactamase superfamily II)